MGLLRSRNWKCFNRMPAEIHPTAIVDSTANIYNASVGPYAIVEKEVEVEDGCKIEAHAVIKKRTILGKNVRVGHFSVVGGDPQHVGFDQSIFSRVVIDDHVRISEGVTIHRSIYSDGITKIGRKCFLMGNSHVAHDCELGEEVVLANGALLGGHVVVDSFTFIGGGAGVHQFTRIGEGAMIGGLSEISKDIPPFTTVSGRNEASGLNLIGIKRRKFAQDDVKALKCAYRYIMMKKGDPSESAKLYLCETEELKSQKAKEFAEFFITKGRGFVRSRSQKSKSLQVE